MVFPPPLILTGTFLFPVFYCFFSWCYCTLLLLLHFTFTGMIILKTYYGIITWYPIIVIFIVSKSHTPPLYREFFLPIFSSHIPFLFFTLPQNPYKSILFSGNKYPPLLKTINIIFFDYIIVLNFHTSYCMKIFHIFYFCRMHQKKKSGSALSVCPFPFCCFIKISV